MIEKENTKSGMSKIESIIESYCDFDHPADVEWTLYKEDVPLIAEKIKKALLEEIRDYCKVYIITPGDVIDFIEGL